MILSDKTIKEKIANGELEITPFDESCVQPASVDLHLDSRIIVFRNHQFAVLDVKEKIENSELINVSKEGFFIIHPGQFVLGNTVESFKLPDNLLGRLDGRSSIGRLGLIVHATAGFIDPGYKGNITLEMLNVSTIAIKLYVDMRIGQISFEYLTTPSDIPYGSKKGRNKYNGQTDPLPSMIWKDFK